MGLCKCRKVTPLFCAKHRTNVCEQCMLSDHPSCVVKTYLQWLQDTDVSLDCALCRSSLENGDTVRLPCYDVFHVGCLDAYAKSQPQNTAPAGFQCPVCKAPVVPAANDMSLIAQQARQVLSSFTWAYPAGLGSGIVDSVAPPPTAGARGSTIGEVSAPQKDGHRALQSQPMEAAPVPTATVTPTSTEASSITTQRQNSSEDAQPVIQTVIQGSNVINRRAATQDETSVSIPADADSDENKYQRRPAGQWLGRVVGNRQPATKHQDTSASLKRAIFLLILAVLGLTTIIELLTRVRPSGVNDPLLDPALNPNLQTE